VEYVCFPWLSTEAALSIFNFNVCLKKMIFEKELIKMRSLTTMLNHMHQYTCDVGTTEHWL
jgi:hypothetical protein